MRNISIVIPCYNDEQALTKLLTQIASWPQQPYEIIVIDGANSQLCKTFYNRLNVQWQASEPCRGKQLLLGASLAQGHVLWFLHADAKPAFNAIDEIQIALSSGVNGGYFKFQFNTTFFWPARFLEFAIALRCRFGIPYGDQGLFIAKQAYIDAGGHAPWPLFEEVPLVKNLRKQGRFSALSTPILVDTRRWQNDGWWRRTFENRKLALAFLLGKAPQKLAKQYRSQITNFNLEK